MIEFAIIDMHEHHLDDVVRIERDTSATPWSASVFLSEIDSPTHILLAAVVKNVSHPQIENVIGFAGGQVVSDELHIHSLAVDETQRRNGVGTALISALIRAGKSHDARSATLEVRVSNIGAQDLYTSLGFISEGIRPKYYADNGEDANIMWLRSCETRDA